MATRRGESEVVVRRDACRWRAARKRKTKCRLVSVRHTYYWVERLYTSGARRVVKIASSLTDFAVCVPSFRLLPFNYSVIFKKSRRRTAERRVRVVEATARFFSGYFFFGSREFNGQSRSIRRRASRNLSNGSRGESSDGEERRGADKAEVRRPRGNCHRGRDKTLSDPASVLSLRRINCTRNSLAR